MNERQFVEQYVLNAVRGATDDRLTVSGLIAEARKVWAEMERQVPRETEKTG